MGGRGESGREATGGFWRRLARDTCGNTMAIMAIALIPLAGMVGGGVDITRMYIVKTRLQHACDAGALAGRKTMGGGVWAQTATVGATSVPNYPDLQAKRFFDNNLSSTAYGMTSVSRAFIENAGRVTGTASATIPMTLMRIFGRASETMSVTCQAEMRLPNTDVMFVLDVTGSMDNPIPGDSEDKIVGLRRAVKCFYQIVARLDVDDVDCEGDEPVGGTGDGAQIRFGFVPYATNANVGKLLPADFLANRWKYQSREPEWDITYTNTYPDPAVDSIGTPGSTTGTWSGWERYNRVNSTQNGTCAAAPASNTVTGTNSSSDSQAVIDPNTGVKTWETRTTTGTAQWEYRVNKSSSYVLFSGWRYYCDYDRRSRGDSTWTTVIHTQYPVRTENKTFRRWHYGYVSHDISGLKKTNPGVGVSPWNASVDLPLGTGGGASSVAWGGCIEERKTVRQSTYTPIPNAAYDLRLDLLPSQSDAETLWGPVLQNAIYTRKNSNGSWTMDERWTTENYGNGSSYSCPTEGRKLQKWPAASEFKTYVNSFRASGNTYHDIGLIWGARLMWPDGIFKSENESTPQGGEIERHMIFMTDGESCTSNTNYTAYGVAWYDRRQTSESAVPTDGCLNEGTLTQQVNARTAALCTAIKNKNITLWVIWFGETNTTVEDMLEACATGGRFFSARNSTQLQTTFKSIADQISQLRLTN